MRVGMGYDVHRLVEDRPLILGGVEIPYEKGLLGHSDADVLLHAIMDALLGAAALGDIGKHFPDTDAAYKGASSIKLLEHVGKNVADTLGIELDQVNIKATTEEGLGFTGSGEGISSQAICSISSYYEHMVNNAPAGCASCGGCARN